MSLVSDLLPTLDAARGILDDVGLRPFQVFVRTRDWSEGIVGRGAWTDTDTEITVADGKRPKVKEVRSKDVSASGGAIAASTYEVGPLTPDYGAGGAKADELDPPMVDGREVLFIVKGPGLAEDGVLCKRVGGDSSSPFRWSVRLERLGQNA